MLIEEKIGMVLSEQSFYEDNKDLSEREDIIKAIQEKVPEATAGQIDDFLNKVSSALQQKNSEALSEDELEDVAGGIVVTAAVIGTVCGCVSLALTAGGIIGSAIWYWKNRKKKNK